MIIKFSNSHNNFLALIDILCLHLHFQFLGVDNGNPVILQSSDLSKVFEKTKSACKKWKAIGRWLGFKKDELSSMVHADGNTRREDFYETMLSLWLDWAPPYHSFPTVQQLSQALYEVNNKKQAFDLNDAYGMSA